MKKHIPASFIVLLCYSHFGFAQPFLQYCGSPRYDTEVFPTVTVTNDVVFGSNTDVNGNAVSLTMDIYQPTGDTASIRPLIVWAHGGSFVSGTKADADVSSLCNHFAKRGYVCVSINYRLGIPLPPDQTGTTRAVYRAVQDMKAAIRFFRMDAATANLYHTDPNVIFAAGSSAGAVMALHLAYLDQPAELPSQIDTTLLGGIEGNSGNPGYPSTVNAIVNLCGALGDTTWMTPGDIPVCSMHGTADNIVPYATAMLYLFGAIPIMIVNGSHSVTERAMHIGIPNVMYTYYGQSHVPYAGSTAEMDTTVRFVSNFLYAYMGCTPSDPDPLPNTFPTGIESPGWQESSLSVYPNPAADYIFVDTRSDLQKLDLVDVTGRVMKHVSQQPAHSKTKIDCSSFSPGIYFLVAEIIGQTISGKIILNGLR